MSLQIDILSLIFGGVLGAGGTFFAFKTLSNFSLTKIKELKEKERELEEREAKLREESEKLEKERERAKADLERTKKKKEELERQTRELREELSKAKSQIEKAKLESEVILSKAKEEALKMKEEFYREREAIQRELDKQKFELQVKEKDLNKLQRDLELWENELKAKTAQIDMLHKEAQEVLKKALDELERVANMSRDEARELILKRVQDEMKIEIAKLVKAMEDEAMQELDKKVKKMLLTTLYRVAPESTAEYTVTTISLPSDEYKGRIIGREGRNIRFFEELTGVDVIIDDTPEVVTISCFDPIRREKARLTLERLIMTGKINPATIEEMYYKVDSEVENMIIEAGQNAAIEALVPDLHPELIKILGRLKYRTSYGQNVLQHSVQVAHIAAILASELNANVKVARRAGLLHDIGKAINSPTDETHAVLGARIARTYGESEEVAHAIEAHHNDVEPQTLEAQIIAIADAISASRPGARRESYELFIQRLRKLEEIASSFDGVEKAYVIQAGRQIVVFVKPDQISDEETFLLSKEIAKRIESELTYPGHIKVNVIRKVIGQELAK